MTETETKARHTKVLIVGSGPAGYTAAIYAARADLKPIVLAGSGTDPDVGIPGGQLMLTTDVENYPGFPKGVTGPDMMELFRSQATRFGSEVLHVDAVSIDLSHRPIRVESGDGSFTCDALILATGARAKWLGLPSEERLQNRGVSACATCDGALYRGKDIAVVGGGDTAVEEALFLTRYGTKVTVIHRRDELRASKILQERAFANDKIEFLWNSVVTEVLGDDEVTGVRIKNVKNGKESELAVGALFVAIGHKPNTDMLRGQLEVDELGYVKVQHWSTRTSAEGVFACGDVVDRVYRQAVTAAGTGCMAAIDAERWLAERESEEAAKTAASGRASLSEATT
ncbi:MAG: thioredoxin-disulfide reductase [Acidobacteriota bacterium]